VKKQPSWFSKGPSKIAQGGSGTQGLNRNVLDCGFKDEDGNPPEAKQARSGGASPTPSVGSALLGTVRNNPTHGLDGLPQGKDVRVGRGSSKGVRLTRPSQLHGGYQAFAANGGADWLMSLRRSSQNSSGISRNILTMAGSNCRPDHSAISLRAVSKVRAGR